jgi:hypothetical protein
LILNRIQFEDREKLLYELGHLSSLKYLVHDLIFTPSEVAALKARIPELNVLLLSEYEAGFEAGMFKNP